MYQRPTLPQQTAPAPFGGAPVSAATRSNGPGAGQSGGAKSAVVPMLEISLQRLEEIVDQETLALKNRKVIDLNDFNNRKSQALLELTRTLRLLQGGEANPDLAARVGALKSKLDVNQQVLRMHLEAVREISTSLSDAIRSSESDGTYTQAISSVARGT